MCKQTKTTALGNAHVIIALLVVVVGKHNCYQLSLDHRLGEDGYRSHDMCKHWHLFHGLWDLVLVGVDYFV